MTDEADCFLYCDKLLCEECGLATRDDICDSSGKPLMMWEGCAQQDCWPQHHAAAGDKECADCGQRLDWTP